MLVCGKVAQDNFVELTAAPAIPITFSNIVLWEEIAQKRIDLRCENCYNENVQFLYGFIILRTMEVKVMRDISLELSSTIKKELKACTRIQSLVMALLGLERTWQMFLDWTYQESTPYLLCKPETFRQPVRDALDLLWEQVYDGQIHNQHKDFFDRLRDQINQSFDEDDGQDVDFGTATPLVNQFFDSIGCFFEITPERQSQRPWCDPDYYVSRAAYCATTYAEALSNFLNNEYSLLVERDAEEIFDCVEKDPLWQQEVQRIYSDLSLVLNYPANRDMIEQRRQDNAQLRTLPFCKN